MAHWTHKTEHNGAKNGGGFYGTRLEAKTSSNVGRRHNDRRHCDEGLREHMDSENEIKKIRKCACGHDQYSHRGHKGTGGCMYADGPRGCNCKAARYSEEAEPDPPWLPRNT